MTAGSCTSTAMQVAGAWANGGEAENASAELDLVAGKQYILVLEYYEATGGAAARLRWSGPGISKQAIWQGALQTPQCAISPSPAQPGRGRARQRRR